MANRKHQLDDLTECTNAIPETFHNSLVEKTALKQSPSEGEKLVMDKSDLADQLAAFTAAIDNMHRETKAQGESLLLAIHSLSDRVSELLRNSDKGQEPKTQTSLLKAVQVTPHSFAQDVAKMSWAKWCLDEDKEKVLTFFPVRMPVATTHTWTFDGYASLNEIIKTKGHANAMLEPAYVRGYCVSLGVRTTVHGNFCILFQLHKGETDMFLEWPFNEKIKVGILQPEGDEKVEDCVTPESTGFKKRFSRPVKDSNDLLPVFDKHLPPDGLERRGFIKGGRMLLSLTLEAS